MLKLKDLQTSFIPEMGEETSTLPNLVMNIGESITEVLTLVGRHFLCTTQVEARPISACGQSIMTRVGPQIFH